ncbi:Uncharacterized protein Cob_v002500 [Colletotrichum orbiculare MAFF 240422]|uniref:Uncharacterized protein n=1 Tax=Colletotrichum orbiculare (strain 104-T / ATCC 96160 / CBS 514.97 / LARS 414 / MAFF 240422) TaxID=1213857 RepID=N4VRE8_COLOR|nr:Uncharacterized protein Cob_v002500 [Colletotrichum orbiculare MAFF 240422]
MHLNHHVLSAAALALLTLPWLVSAEQQQQQHTTSFGPSISHARENAPFIFNAVHSAMRQWGSSVHHNGLGVMPATVPRGTLLFHGTRANVTPSGPEWLAFEMEHSENFARSWKGGRGSPAPRPPPPPPPGGKPREPPRGGRQPPAVMRQDEEQRRLGHGGDGGGGDDWEEEERPAVRGYFHTYRATRDLKLLYIDGMAAGKTGMGTLDTQDFFLRGLESAPGFGEFERARDVCEVVGRWGLDGVVRMEIGFESIYCDFFDGLELVSVLRRPWSDTFEGRGGVDMFEWTRAVSQRYDGIGGGRVRLDFSGMVSGFWYPLNVSNPNGRRDMPRLGKLDKAEREAMLGRVEENVKRSRRGEEGSVDWQGVVDLVVTRHADRIEMMAAEGEVEAFVSQVMAVTNTFVDYPRDEFDAAGLVEDARERCARHHLTPATVWRGQWTEEDGLIYAAVESVVERVCGRLYDVRGLLVDAAPALSRVFGEGGIRSAVEDGREDAKLAEAVQRGREAIEALREELGWSAWKKCRPGCDVGEVCFVAMWPFGLKEDHYNPSCQNRTSLMGRGGRGGGGDEEEEGYWEWEPRP